MPTQEQLTKLQSLLPAPSERLNPANVDRQARAVLATFLNLVQQAMPGTPLATDPSTCPNCGTPTESKRSPYCSEACREESAFVRQLRAAIESGKIEDEERQASIGQNLWHLLGGGFPRRQKLVDQKARARFFRSRNEGRCEICGAPATTFDHTGSG